MGKSLIMTNIIANIFFEKIILQEVLYKRSLLSLSLWTLHKGGLHNISFTEIKNLRGLNYR